MSLKSHLVSQVPRDCPDILFNQPLTFHGPSFHKMYCSKRMAKIRTSKFYVVVVIVVVVVSRRHRLTDNSTHLSLYFPRDTLG